MFIKLGEKNLKSNYSAIFGFENQLMVYED